MRINVKQEEEILAIFNSYLYNGFKLVRKEKGFELTLFISENKEISDKCNKLLKKLNYKIKLNYNKIEK